eukprot:342341_1
MRVTRLALIMFVVMVLLLASVLTVFEYYIHIHGLHNVSVPVSINIKKAEIIKYHSPECPYTFCKNKSKSFMVHYNVNNINISINHMAWSNDLVNHSFYDITINNKTTIIAQLMNVMFTGKSSMQFILAVKFGKRDYIKQALQHCSVTIGIEYVDNGTIICADNVNPNQQWFFYQLQCKCLLNGDVNIEYIHDYEQIFRLYSNLTYNQQINAYVTKYKNNAYLSLCCETIIHDHKDGYGPPPNILFYTYFEYYINQMVDNIFIYDLKTNLSNVSKQEFTENVIIYDKTIKNKHINLFIFDMSSFYGHKNSDLIYNQYQILIVTDCHLRNKLISNWTMFNDLDEYVTVNYRKHKNIKSYLIHSDIINSNITEIGLHDCAVRHHQCSKYDYLCIPIEYNKRIESKLNNFLDNIRYINAGTNNECKHSKHKTKYINKPKFIDTVRVHMSFDYRTIDKTIGNIKNHWEISNYSMLSNPDEIMYYHYKTIWHSDVCNDIIDNSKQNKNSDMQATSYMLHFVYKKYKFLYGPMLIGDAIC